MKFVWFATIVCVAAVAQQPRFVEKLPGGENAYYVGNRTPLAPSPLMKLPIGAVRPNGWLRTQLELAASGFPGRLSDISPFCKFEGNAWTSRAGRGDRGWEEVPYWLKGFTDLGLLLGDPRIQTEARKWLDAVLSNQREDGYFGNRKNLDVRKGEQPAMNTDRPDRVVDLWPNMIMLFPLRSLYEATGDARVIPFMTKYFRWQLDLPVDRFLPGSWQKYRGGDNLDSIYWLYNRTGDRWLLDLAERTHRRTADWFENIPTWHGVNISQGFREPAQYFQQSKDPKFVRASEVNYQKVMGEYGQVPGGMFAADENARRGYAGPRQGAETCSIAEYMLSHEMLTKITGDALWADRTEEVAFNSLPASMTPDLKGLHYLTAPNMVQLDRKNKAPMLENGGDMLSYNPYQYRCCQHNAAHAWPYFAEHLWMATPGNGLAAVLYAPSSVKAKVGDGTDVRLDETTSYPFDGVVQLKLRSPKPVRFPLTLRVPDWTRLPALAVNGTSVPLPKVSRGWLTITREWRDGDVIRFDLPMRISVRRWPSNGGVSIYRGPLAYSVKIGERWERYGASAEWPAYEVYATSPWNYALDLDPAAPQSSLLVKRSPGPLKPQPFTPENAPLAIHVQARRVPEWKLEENGLIQELPRSPARASEPAEQITLIPMGCARLRVSVFPVVKR